MHFVPEMRSLRFASVAFSAVYASESHKLRDPACVRSSVKQVFVACMADTNMGLSGHNSWLFVGCF